MMNDHYQPPRSPETSSMPQFLHEQGPLTHEWYVAIKSMEQQIDTFRAEADASVIPRNTLLKKVMHLGHRAIGLQPDEKTLREQLIEEESKMGGQMLPALGEGVTQRFWYGDGDWFYRVKSKDSDYSVRYQLIEGRLHKLVAGRAVAIDETEQASFLTWTATYYEKVRTELYHRANNLDEELEYLLSAPDIKKELTKDDFALTA